MRFVGNKVSYVRIPFAKRSFPCLFFAVLALGLGIMSIYLSVRSAGQGGPNTGAFGFSSIVAAALGLWYGLLSFLEKERRYVLARVGIGIAGVLLIVWIVIIIVGVVR